MDAADEMDIVANPNLARDLIVNTEALSVNNPDNADNTADKNSVLTAGMTAQ